MAVHWALQALCVLPLLNPQNPACDNIIAMPITSAALDWFTTRWFFTAAAFRNPEHKQEAQEIQAEFFYLEANPREDTVAVREHITIGDRCIQRSSLVRVQRENGTFTKIEGDKEYLAQVLLLRDPGTFMLAYFLEDEQNRGLSFFTDKPEATPEQLEAFRQAIQCVGLRASEIQYLDWKKNKCQLQEQDEINGEENP